MQCCCGMNGERTGPSQSLCGALQREAGQESPFLEFIQRVCSECKNTDGSCRPIKPGCGGFGIRNFLTLFLSIEVRPHPSPLTHRPRAPPNTPCAYNAHTRSSAVRCIAVRCGTVCRSARQCAFAFWVTNAQVSKAMLEFEEAQARSDAKAMDLANRKVELFTQQLDESNPVLTAISDCMTAEGELRADAAATSDAKRQAELLAKAEVKRVEKEAGNLKLQVVRAHGPIHRP